MINRVRTLKLETLPDILPVFPLPGAMLLPGGQLPLNIFEPRYLNMIEDALAASRSMTSAAPAGSCSFQKPVTVVTSSPSTV